MAKMKEKKMVLSNPKQSRGNCPGNESRSKWRKKKSTKKGFLGLSRVYVRNGKEGLLTKDIYVRGQERKGEREIAKVKLNLVTQMKIKNRDQNVLQWYNFFFFLKYRKRKLAALGWHILKAQVGREAFVVITSGWGTADGKIQTHSTDKKPLQTIKQPMTKLKLEVFLVRVEVNSPSPGQSIQEGSNLFWLESTPCNNTRLGFAINTASWNLLFWNMLTTTSSQRNLNKRMTRVWWCVMMSV